MLLGVGGSSLVGFLGRVCIRLLRMSFTVKD